MCEGLGGRGSLVWGEVVEADLWRSGGNGRAGETWGLCGACQRSERAAGSALIGNCHPRAKMGRLAALRVFHREPSRSSRFHNRQRWQAAEAARFAFSRLWCLGGLMMESRALRADIRGAIRDEKFPLAVEKWRP